MPVTCIICTMSIACACAHLRLLPDIVLPRTNFPNGAHWYESSSQVRQEALIVHYNWVVANEKAARMDDDGLWFLRERPAPK